MCVLVALSVPVCILATISLSESALQMDMQHSASLLVVEDDAALSELLRNVLEDEGYQVVVADSLARAADVLKERPVDLVLADLIEFDQRGGPGALHALRDLAGDRPVLLCSGQPEAQDLGGQMKLAGVLTKPFDLEVLLDAVRAALPEGEPRGSAPK